MMKTEKQNPCNIICYDPFINRWGGFGDGWRWCSYLLQFSEQNPKKTIVVDGIPRTKNFLRIMKPLFDTTGNFVLDHPPGNYEQHRIGWNEFFAHQQLPTKKQWTGNRGSNIICYQFDGECEAKIKNSPPEDVNYLIQNCKNMGYTPVNIGGVRPMEFIIDTIVNSCLFVGVGSGMACLSISTGVPMYIITNKLSPRRVLEYNRTWHGSKDIKYLRTTHDFIHELSNIKKENANRSIKLL